MTPRQTNQAWDAERLAYWYFRLNGFLTTENFVVHPDRGRNQRTDADVLGVRFANRAENSQRPMVDDPKVTSCETFANIIIAEVKTGPCALNRPWTDPSANNLQRVLKAIGCVPDPAILKACTALYRSGRWSDDAVITVRLLAIGENRTNNLPIPAEQQITWKEVIGFCTERLSAYRQEKSSVGQWSRDGQKLMDASLSSEAEPLNRKHGPCSG